jgi:GTP cyclohydrolase II
MPNKLECNARTSLPVRGKRMDILTFGLPGAHMKDEPEIVALVNGFRRTDDDSAVVRLHSACFTGDILGSEKCDCGTQLEASLDVIARSPWGILVYLAQQEGRGMGLVQKLHAYGLQDEGFDTVTANEQLHATVDDRSYESAADVLRYLDARRIWLLTNNPDKVIAMRTAGIQVDGVQRLSSRTTQFNRAYVNAKRLKFGHIYEVERIPGPSG